METAKVIEKAQSSKKISEHNWKTAASILANDLAEMLYQQATQVDNDYFSDFLNNWADKFQRSHGQYSSYQSELVHLLQEVVKLKSSIASGSFNDEIMQEIDEILRDVFGRLSE